MRPSDPVVVACLQSAGGVGAVKLVQVRQSGASALWTNMQNTYGSAWEVPNAPSYPLDVNIISSDGESVSSQLSLSFACWLIIACSCPFSYSSCCMGASRHLLLHDSLIGSLLWMLCGRQVLTHLHVYDRSLHTRQSQAQVSWATCPHQCSSPSQTLLTHRYGPISASPYQAAVAAHTRICASLQSTCIEVMGHAADSQGLRYLLPPFGAKSWPVQGSSHVLLAQVVVSCYLSLLPCHQLLCMGDAAYSTCQRQCQRNRQCQRLCNARDACGSGRHHQLSRHLLCCGNRVHSVCHSGQCQQRQYRLRGHTHWRFHLRTAGTWLTKPSKC